MNCDSREQAKLSKLKEKPSRIERRGRPPTAATPGLRWATDSPVKPHSWAIRSQGAEAPKWSTPIIRPSSPTIRSHPKVAAASIETRGIPSPSTEVR